MNHLQSGTSSEQPLTVYTIDEDAEDTASQILTSIPKDVIDQPTRSKEFKKKSNNTPYLTDKYRREDSIYSVHRFHSISAATTGHGLRMTNQHYPSVLEDVEKRVRLCCIPIITFACSSVFGKLILILIGLLSIGLPISMITVGALKLNQCPADQMIVAYLLLGGGGALCAACCLTTICRDTGDDRNINANHCSWFLNVFTVIWFVCGAIWIFKLNPNFKNESDKNFCDPLVYRFTYSLITSTIVVIIIILIAAPIGIIYKLYTRK